MTKLDYLNTASDLRRAAYWTAMGTNQKFVSVLLKNLEEKPELKRFLQIDLNLEHKLLAEELLMASHRLQNI
ncbi:MAG: hypothetical protein ACD_77C00305G0005 [uncultured bacterium]|uniref:Uncharacterized protein n=1 Tax=Candidatus Woesebacteria bacterium GW2011_GWA1_40_43 TaxID=1618553 RepID=A0A0G0UPE8_9BACT|nr:MAG: hypothetical protein ACD_77C00305G0005 [uncultured bacterium]KKR53490.1 MAG: hypothetical protein UT88_C0009G0022 [Candidatus Woesebacteria bacterium GW2011_GWD2_40_19]KKR57358.1 MAG: hypothetical protein UT96_C0021G0014 [Candidatus Woesebacteria bacterium GW2011_GWC2_40_30]KKR61570.1 MAG: hypothetical protein UU02_C0057G0008 [Candidatus Woesebacteria bacterium GW2011_GWA1_40_43]HAU65549.1 hypothetical protein [Candidatus Woesebacteria bacterium]